MAAGICVVSQNAFGVGVTAVPDPIGDDAWDGWMWFWEGSLIVTDATDPELQGGGTARIPIDNKSMRKMNETDTLIGVVGVVETGTATMIAQLETRVLEKPAA